MKLKRLFAAIALAFAGQAVALPPTTVPNLDVFESGASAQQRSLGALFDDLCTAGSLDVYYDTATNGSNYRAYFCTAPGFGNVLFNNRARGGSFFGVNPVARAEAIERMTVDASCVATGNVFPAVPQYTCPNVEQDIPDFGVSDVEPALFTGINVATGDTQLTLAELTQLLPAAQHAVVFGVAVSVSLYTALQTAQGLPVGDLNSDAARPSLSKAQITAVIDNINTVYHINWAAIGVPANPPVIVCRRVNGSGTQASSNQYFMSNPCSLPAYRLTPAVAANSNANYTVVENSTSGGVRSCLTNASNASRFALGVISLESIPSPTDQWRFIKIDGVDPTLVNTVNGLYDFTVEQSIQRRSVVVDGVPVLSGAALSFYNTFSNRSGQASILAAIPNNGTLGNGTAALLTRNPVFPGPGNILKGLKFGAACRPQRLLR